MTWDEDDFDFDPNASSNVATVQLYVSGGNRHLPNGNQVLSLVLTRNTPHSEELNAPSIWMMWLITDGRRSLFDAPSEEPTIENRVSRVTRTMVSWAELPIERVMVFRGEFEGVHLASEEEVTEAARRYLGIDNLEPPHLPTGFVLRTEDGKYGIGDRGFDPPPFSTLILDTPTEGDITVRVFVFANWFYFELERMVDFNFLVLHGDDDKPYARLLSEQLLEDLP